MKGRKKIITRIIYVVLIGFVLLNIIAFFHAYKFTHFTAEKIQKTRSPEKQNSIDKLNTLFFGVNNPRPENKLEPTANFEKIKLQSNKKIACWHIKSEEGNPADSIHGTVILFHGYGGEKSSMLDKSQEFNKLKYNTFLVDFMGSGDSEGNQTTIGFKEAEEVKTAFEYLTKRGEKNIYLFGTSMGAVAIMKAISDYDLKPKGIIIECPFGSLYQTTCARFKTMNTPTFPLASLLVFWGGVQNNFWAFGHKPTEYAKKINCPTLLLYGKQDKKVSSQEINDIYNNIKGIKYLKTYELAGHENYLIKYKNDWKTDIEEFLTTN